MSEKLVLLTDEQLGALEVEANKVRRGVRELRGLMELFAGHDLPVKGPESLEYGNQLTRILSAAIKISRILGYQESPDLRLAPAKSESPAPPAEKRPLAPQVQTEHRPLRKKLAK